MEGHQAASTRPPKSGPTTAAKKEVKRLVNKPFKPACITYYSPTGEFAQLRWSMPRLQVTRELREKFAIPAHCMILSEERNGRVEVSLAVANQETREGFCSCCFDSSSVAGRLSEPERSNVCMNCSWIDEPLCAQCMLHHARYHHCALCFTDKQLSNTRQRDAHWSRLTSQEKQWAVTIGAMYDAMDNQDSTLLLSLSMLLPLKLSWSAQVYCTMMTETESSYRVLERDIIQGIMILEIVYKDNKHKLYWYRDENPSVKILYTSFLLWHEQTRLKLAARDHILFTCPELCNQCHCTERTTTTTTIGLEPIHGIWSRGYYSEPLKDISLLSVKECSEQ